MPSSDPTVPNSDPTAEHLVRRHLRFGWWSLLVFVILGIALEALHGFKVGAYLDSSQASRRLMWTLAHAHGTLLSILHFGFAFSVEKAESWPQDGRRLASRCLLISTLLLPGGFFLAGTVTYSGDPGVGVMAVAAGGLTLLLAVLLTARGASAR